MLTRRSLLRSALAAVPLAALWRRSARAASFGPLIPDPAGILDLPAGFSYRIVERRGEPMTDGYRVPGLPDGMACFAGPGGTLILLRNHELSAGHGAMSAYGPDQPAPAEAYDPAELGGVTRVVVNATTGERLSSNLVLVGTTRNCAGGLSPWGWLTCEETTIPGHGYVFACPPDAAAVRAPQRIAVYGRFNHEAASVERTSRIAYLTEDEDASCLYRFAPDQPAAPFVGRLQALRITSAANLDTGTNHPVGTSWPIAWVDVDDPDGATVSVFAQAQARGAAIVRRGEGLWIRRGIVYFVSTSGGPAGSGQIFQLTPSGDGGTLTLLARGEVGGALDMPDNLTVAPWGDIYIVEDGGGEDLIRILDTQGTVTSFARNALSSGELAGLCFSPDGSLLFVNMQVDGLTLAISGPFPVVAVEPEPAIEPFPSSGSDPDPPDPTPDPDPMPGPGPSPMPDDGGCDAGSLSAGGLTIAVTGAALLAARRRASDNDPDRS